MKKRIEGFRQYLTEDEKSENTARCYAAAAGKYFQVHDEVTKQGMLAFKRQMIEEYSPATAALRCTAMNRYCDYIGRPDCRVKAVRTPKRLTSEDVPTEDEYNYFISCLERDGLHKWKWMLAFIAKTGARISEVVRFERKHLQAGKAELMSKGKIRRVYIPGSLIEESRGYFDSAFAQRPDCRWLFPNRLGGQMSRDGARKQIRVYGQRYGIRDEILHPHSFRHLFAIQFLRRNNNIALLADLMGHESVETTSIYLKLSMGEQKKQLDEAMKW